MDTNFLNVIKKLNGKQIYSHKRKIKKLKEQQVLLKKSRGCYASGSIQQRITQSLISKNATMIFHHEKCIRALQFKTTFSDVWGKDGGKTLGAW